MEGCWIHHHTAEFVPQLRHAHPTSWPHLGWLRLLFFFLYFLHATDSTQHTEAKQSLITICWCQTEKRFSRPACTHRLSFFKVNSSRYDFILCCISDRAAKINLNLLGSIGTALNVRMASHWCHGNLEGLWHGMLRLWPHWLTPTSQLPLHLQHCLLYTSDAADE